jgi:histidinol dehydrogenase
VNRATDVLAAPPLRLRRFDLSTASRDELAGLTHRRTGPDPRVREGAARIVSDVRSKGDDAVRSANGRFGGGLPDGRLVLTADELARACAALTSGVRVALEQAIEHVERFATTQRPVTSWTRTADGIEIERRWVPLDRVGCYVPGGSAPYPSSLIMTVAPARIAGVGSIVVASPADPSGRLDPVLLGAAGLLGVQEFIVAGGAQAVGALAYGLPEAGVAPVDRIVGPGNAWVTAAKIEVASEVAIDLPAGPSEGMVLADATSDPVLVAADLLTQAEHGLDSPAILVTLDHGLADAVEAQIDAVLPSLERREIVARSLAALGPVVLAPDIERAIEFINAYAPEHLSIAVADPEAAVERIRHAGSVFVGPWAPESAGDYATGANHVLPTGGLARACGPLAVDAFGHYVQIQRLTHDGLERIRKTIVTLATAEGMTAHRNAVEVRFRGRPDKAAAQGASVEDAARASSIAVTGEFGR